MPDKTHQPKQRSPQRWVRWAAARVRGLHGTPDLAPQAVVYTEYISKLPLPRCHSPSRDLSGWGKDTTADLSPALLWKFPWGGFGKPANSSLPLLPLHLLMPQQEPHYPQQGLSCDQGKYYLALLMFNVPPIPGHPTARHSPRSRGRGKRAVGRARLRGDMAGLSTDDGECVCACKALGASDHLWRVSRTPLFRLLAPLPSKSTHRPCLIPCQPSR